jgi:glutaconate CoA-transferase subunit B
MEHEKRRFVDKLDYFTSPGWLHGNDSREKAGFNRGGPMAVVTNLGIMAFHPSTKEMLLSQHYPGVYPEDVAKNTGFEVDLSKTSEVLRPTELELKTLRDQVDPQRLLLG